MENFFTKKTAIITLVLVNLVTAYFLSLSPRLRLDYEFERFFPKSDPELEFYYNHRKQYETDNDFILIAIRPAGGIFNYRFLSQLDTITDALRKLPGITDALSLTNYEQPIESPLGMMLMPILNVEKVHDYYSDSLYLMHDPLIKGNLLSNDGRSTVILLKNNPKISKKESDVLLQSIEQIVKDRDFEEVHLAGKIHGQYHYIKKMGKELVFFSIISILILTVFLYFTFRTLWGIWVPLLIVGTTIIWLMGMIIITGQPLSILTIILPTILFVVGISDSVHLLEKFIEELRKGQSKLNALKIAYKEVGMATFFTCLTTAVGFFSLTTSSIEPITEFAIFTGTGVWIAFILSYTLLPALILLLEKPRVAEKKNTEDFWKRLLHRLFMLVMRRQKTIFTISLLLTATAFIGISQLKINNFLLEDWSRNDPEKQDYLFFEEHYAGVRPFELALQVTDTTRDITDYYVLAEINQLENYLQTLYGVGAITSPVTIVKSLYKAQHAGDNSYFRFPPEDEYRLLKPHFAKLIRTGKARLYISENMQEGRLSARGRDFGGYVFKQKNNGLETFRQKEINPRLISFHQTGMAMLIDKNNENLSSDMIIELGLSFAFIGMLMGLLFRSGAMVFISLIPNTIPLILVAGIMGFAGIDLKVSTSIIYSIAFGIAVDDTIHFLSALKLELEGGKNILYALKRTYLSTGKAVVVTGLILCSGFVSLIFSSFASTFYLGSLVSLTLFIALAGDLFLLPVLILWWHSKGRHAWNRLRRKNKGVTGVSSPAGTHLPGDPSL